MRHYFITALIYKFDSLSNIYIFSHQDNYISLSFGDIARPYCIACVCTVLVCTVLYCTARSIPNQDPSLVLVHCQTLLTYIYIPSIYQLRFFYFLLSSGTYFLYYPSPKLIFKAQPNIFGTIRFMQPVSALSPSFFSSSS
jgi:hypothetical protein